ncbi:MAG: hypothetical protein LBS20_06190 [Prevotella sp.]|jgi:hypothetical protein|uniref:hypothetical protein n=1 Tax=unclassified Dysgonomonas TaxID=2630389 RepID=UPI0025C4F2E7|nr:MULTISPECIES: hypothetical protein [unclassified Dysgonomonas]MDR1715415.1 hypothetical protein [Prevotella sp.]MDR2002711.1 hypothetical protein [Prevotella sp.]HMM03602.1 hypothetical protein [Dysgonomonas sp.]
MKAIYFRKSIVLVFTILLSTTVGFAQNDKRTEAAKEAATLLTNTMAESLDLTQDQKEAVANYNTAYTMVLFTTTPLSDDMVKEFDSTLDTNLKGVLNDEQYTIWSEKKNDWLNIIKQKVPKEELPE